MPVTLKADTELALADAIGRTYADPLAFVMLAYDWPVHGEQGPDQWQRENLRWIGEQVRKHRFNGRDAVPPVRDIISSGHGIGKSSQGAWLVHWLMSTRPHCRGTITANTFDQLTTKTWAAIREWVERGINAHWFEVNSQIMYRIGHRSTWFCTPQSCDESNSESFAGQHAKSSSSFYYFDEGSAVPDKIYEVAEGGLTDGESFLFVRGNPTRNTGAFHRAAFGSQQHRWHVTVIDASTTKFSNKELISEWETDYGPDSDFVRVRVRGLPPRASELQWIDADRIYSAQTRIAQSFSDDPLVCGVDVSGGGSAWTVCAFRRGLDARTIKWIALTGEETNAHERQLVVAKLAAVLDEHQPTALFIDTAFGAPIAVRLRQMGYTQVQEVNFGGPSADPTCENARAAMWKSVKDWLPKGAIDPHDHRLATELAGPGYHLNKKNKLVIEAKASMVKRGVASPDRADALALTFAMPVRLTSAQKQASRSMPFPSGPGAWLGS